MIKNQMHRTHTYLEYVQGCIGERVNQQHDALPMKTLFVESLSPPGRPSLEILAASPTVAFAALVASAVILEACFMVII